MKELEKNTYMFDSRYKIFLFIKNIKELDTFRINVGIVYREKNKEGSIKNVTASVLHNEAIFINDIEKGYIKFKEEYKNRDLEILCWVIHVDVINNINKDKKLAYIYRLYNNKKTFVDVIKKYILKYVYKTYLLIKSIL